MISLAQLNQHLDDMHTEEKEPKEIIKDWFRKPLRPLKNIVDKSEKAKESFSGIKERVLKRSESTNETSSIANSESSSSLAFISLLTSNATKGEKEQTACTKCSKALGIIYGKVNCLLCENWFCDTHVPFELKVNEYGVHDPENGRWSKVCDACYKRRDGYNDTTGHSRNWTDMFEKARKDKVERILLDFNLLEKRLEKFIALSSEDKYQGSDRMPLIFGKSSRDLEKSLVPWERDEEVDKCRVCSLQFSFLRRKHHCRLCGKVICGSSVCSRVIILPSDKDSHVTLRTCKTCKVTINRRNKMKKPDPPPVFDLYKELVQSKEKALLLLPEFNNLLLKLSKTFTVNDSDYQIAVKRRQELLDYFNHIDKISKQIKTTSSNTSNGIRRLEDNIYFATIQFLQAHMFTLQLLPSPKMPDENTKTRVLSAQEQQFVKSLKQELSVLIEQSKQVEAYLLEATSKRKFEDAQMLKESLDDIGVEIARMRKELEQYI